MKAHGQHPSRAKHTVTVVRSGYPMIESEFRQPDSIAIESIDVQVLGPSTIIQGGKEVQIRVGFTDPPGGDYYEIAGVAYGDGSGQVLGFTFIDPAYNENNGLFFQTLAFDDTYFNGKTVKLDFKTQLLPPDVVDPDHYWIYLRHLSKEYYLYMKTTSLQYKAATDAFAQPVVIENNIINGYGIFGGFTQTKKAIDIPK